MTNRVGICFTTFLRDELMQKTIQSILDNWKHYYVLLIGDQGRPSEEKNKFYSSIEGENISQWYLPFDCGISYARNFLIQKAKEKHIQLILMSADSIKFTSRYYLEPYIDFLKTNKNHGIIGFDLENRLEWEYYIHKTNCFELTPSDDFVDYDYLRLKRVDIVRNFYLTKIEIFDKIKYDDNLKASEHEDFYYRLKKESDYQVFYSNLIRAKYVTSNYPEYDRYRKENFSNYRKKAIEKWDLTELFRVKGK